jgi:uncharacterized membrane protein YqhA
MMISSAFLLIAGAAKCVHGYVEFLNTGFESTEHNRPGLYLLEGLDNFMSALVFMIFGLGTARLFIFDELDNERLPRWLRLRDIKDLKILLWETILITMVIFCISHIWRNDLNSVEILILPGVIFILSLSLYLVKGGVSHRSIESG